MKSPNFKRLYKDPFLALIAVVILVPALLVVYGIAHQPSHGVASITSAASTDEAPADGHVAGQSTAASSEDPQPITQAEQSVAHEKAPQLEAPTPAPTPGPVCDQAKKQVAEAAKNLQLSGENAQHERQKDKIRVVSKLYHKYWDDEMARHQSVINQIDSTYRTTLAEANC